MWVKTGQVNKKLPGISLIDIEFTDESMAPTHSFLDAQTQLQIEISLIRTQLYCLSSQPLLNYEANSNRIIAPRSMFDLLHILVTSSINTLLVLCVAGRNAGSRDQIQLELSSRQPMWPSWRQIWGADNVRVNLSWYYQVWNAQLNRQTDSRFINCSFNQWKICRDWFLF